MITIVVLFLFCYLLGSLPFAVFMAQLKGVNILSVGSRNPGASNVFRNLGPAYGILTLLLDAGKGAAAVLTAKYVSPDNAWIWCFAGMTAALGHIKSILLYFRGGKGVATFFGMFLALFPLGILASFGVAIISIGLTKRFSVGSLLGAIVFPLTSFIFIDDPSNPEHLPILITSLAALIVILLRHRANILRLIRGTEFLISNGK